MNKENRPVKDRDLTEKKILDAVGKIISENGFEKVGVNAVAQEAGVSKMLIYRYFGNVDELIAHYIMKHDYWINISTGTIPEIENLSEFLKDMFRMQISQLRSDETLKRLYRWELSTSNPITARLRSKREANGLLLIEMISKLTSYPQKEIAALASILSAAISYLALLEEQCPVYNGIGLQSNEGWEQITQGTDLMIDLWIKSKLQ